MRHVDEPSPTLADARVVQRSHEHRVLLIDPSGLEQLLADGRKRQHLNAVDEFRVGTEEGAVVDFGAPQHADDLVGRVRFVVNAIARIHLPIALGGTDFGGEHEAPEVADAFVADGEAIEVQAVPCIDRLRRAFLVAAVAKFVQAARPRMPHKPILVPQVSIVRIARRGVGEIAHEVHDFVAVLGDPRGVVFGHRRCRVEEIPVMEMVIVVQTLAKAAAGTRNHPTPRRVITQRIAVRRVEPRVEGCREGGPVTRRQRGFIEFVRDHGHAAHGRQLLTAEIRIARSDGPIHVRRKRVAHVLLERRRDALRRFEPDGRQRLGHVPARRRHEAHVTLDGRVRRRRFQRLLQHRLVVRQGALQGHRCRTAAHARELPIEHQFRLVAGGCCCHGTAGWVSIGVHVEEGAVRSHVVAFKDGHAQHAVPIARADEGVVAGIDQRDGFGGVQHPRLAVVQDEFEPVIRDGGVRARSVDAENGMNGGDFRGQSVVDRSEVWHAAHDGGLKRAGAVCPFHGYRERIVIDDFVRVQCLIGTQRPIADKRRNDEGFPGGFAGHAAAEAVGAALDDVRQGVGDARPGIERKILPPNVGRQRAFR